MRNQKVEMDDDGEKGIDKIRTEEIRARAGVPNISEKRREVTRRWLGHMDGNIEEDVVMRSDWTPNDR